MKTFDDFKLHFIGIGAFKSATSWIAQCLREHPQICVPYIKELRFFNKVRDYEDAVYWNYKKGLDWYKEQFAECESGNITGEFSNGYLCDEMTPELIKKHFPNVRIIACLRDPVERAYSHYWWNRSNFNRDAQLEFSKALKDRKRVYVENGLYYKHLSRYYALFPRENIHVIIYRHIKDGPQKVMRELYEFLGVDADFVPSSLDKRVNVASKARYELLTRLFKIRAVLEKYNFGFVIDILKRLKLYELIQKLYIAINREAVVYPQLAMFERRQAYAFFAQDIENLEGLINKNLAIWKPY